MGSILLCAMQGCVLGPFRLIAGSALKPRTYPTDWGRDCKVEAERQLQGEGGDPWLCTHTSASLLVTSFAFSPDL